MGKHFIVTKLVTEINGTMIPSFLNAEDAEVHRAWPPSFYFLPLNLCVTPRSLRFKRRSSCTEFGLHHSTCLPLNLCVTPRSLRFNYFA
jgi:hypothetical protein